MDITFRRHLAADQVNFRLAAFEHPVVTGFGHDRITAGAEFEPASYAPAISRHQLA